MGTLSPMSFEAIKPLTDAYAALLAEKVMRTRLAHHLAHVASEGWLALELAHLVNSEECGRTLEGWSALLERKRVDVTLCSPNGDEVFIELKIIDRGCWSENWSAVRADLSGRPGKPKADFALCIMVQPVLPHAVKAKATTLDLWDARFATIPCELGEFSPVQGGAPFRLLATSERIRTSWPRPVLDRWPQGYEADVRILWVGELANEQ